MGKESRGAVCLYRSAHRCTLKDASLVSWRFCKEEEEVEFLVSNGTQKLYYLKGLKDTWWTRYNDPKIASFPYFTPADFPNRHPTISYYHQCKSWEINRLVVKKPPLDPFLGHQTSTVLFDRLALIVKCGICVENVAEFFFGKVGICFLLLTSPGEF